MSNADTPAMGIHHGTIENMLGLTKREHFAATMNHDAKSIIFDKVETLQEFIGRSVDVTDVNDLTFAMAQAETKVRVMRADALLAALEE